MVPRMLLFLLLVSLLPVPVFAQGYLTFPHFATGAGMQSEIVLINPQQRTEISIYLEMYNQDGSHARDLFDGYFTIIPPYGIKRINLGINGPPRVGWMTATAWPWPDTGANLSNGPAQLVGSLKITLPGIGSSTVLDSQSGQTFMLPVKKQGTTNTGIAIANVCSNPLTVIGTLRDIDGLILGTYRSTFPAFTQIAKYIDELIPGRSSYDGSLTVAIGPSVERCIQMSVVSFALGSESGDFVVQPVGKIN